MAYRLTSVIVIFATICSLGVARGQDQDLDALLAEAKASFAPVTDVMVAEAKSALTGALDALDAHLATQPAETSEAWTKSLALTELRTALADAATNLPALQASLAKLGENREGLEHPAFLTTRDALAKYQRALLVNGSRNAKVLYEKQIDTLAGKLKAFEQQSTPAAALEIGNMLGNLELAGQAEKLVAAVRARYRRPNLQANISERLASAGIEQPLDRTQTINEVILGTATSGTAQLTGTTRLDLKPNDDQAEMEIILDGVANSSNVGVNRGVTIWSQGHTKLDGGAKISLTEEGVTTYPAWATAATGTTVTGLWHKSCLVRKIAWNRVGQQKGQAEQEASQKAANRLAGELNKEADTTVGRLNQNYLEKFRYPLLRKSQFPSLLKAVTTDDALSLLMTEGAAYQLAATSELPAMKDGMDLSVRLHESFVGNMSQGLIGGETLTSESLTETLKDLSGEVPEGLTSEDEPPWSVTFSNVTPVQVAFEDNVIRISIRGRRFTRGESVVSSEMEIATAYKIERTEKGARLSRIGEVTAEYTKKGFQSPEKIAIKTVMRKKFTALFPDEREMDGLELPGRWKSVGKLQVQQLDCGKQWIALGWTMPASPANVSETEGDTDISVADAAE